MIKVSTLKTNPGNPRQIKGDKLNLLKASVSGFQKMMDLRPIIVDEENVVLGGNMRLAAIRSLGMKEVPDSWVKRAEGLTEDEKREFVIKDNAGFGEWDWDVIANEWDDLPLADWGLDVPGFEPVDEPGDVDAEPQIDKAAELNKKWGVVSRDLWQIGEHRLICGDSTNTETVERLLDGAKPNLMVTDPPYGVEYENAKGAVTNDDIADWTDAYLKFKGNVAYVWHSDRFSLDIGLNLRLAGFEIRSQIIWCKTSPVMSRGHYNYQHEGCWYGVRKGQTSAWKGDMTQSTFWKLERDDQAHPTVKPLECMARPIRNHEGDVYEPFAGSGTTLVACQNLNRKCYAIEISENYCAVILERMATAFPDIEIKRLDG